MSVSPPIRRYSSTSSSSREDLINQYEAEEERIINVLSRKLERLREEKIALENTLEAESESHVNRLSREISALRLAQQQQAQANGTSSGSDSPVDTRLGSQAFLGYKNPAEPTPETMLETMRRENEQLRSRLVDTERAYIRITRLNEIYREELIEHRRRLGLPVDNLIGLSSVDPLSQPTHQRSNSSASSPSTSILASPSPQQSHPPRPSHGVPIPRPPSQIHRPANNIPESTAPLSCSSSYSSSSPFPFSPSSVSPLPASYTSASTAMTTPPSSATVAFNPPAPYPETGSGLSYPSVPPPSLSSSFGSPSTSYHMHAPHPTAFAHDGPPSPTSSFRGRGHSFHRRGSFDRGARVAETGSLRSLSSGSSRRASVERGARIAETGTLIPRGREGQRRDESLQEAAEDVDVVAATANAQDGTAGEDKSAQQGSL